VLRRRTGEDGRSSLFDAGEVESLARRGRPRHPVVGEFVIESALTEITSDRACYRGFDITSLAARYELEDAAWLLWTGEVRGRDSGPWRASQAALRAGRAAQAALPSGILPLERFGVIVPALAAADPLRLQLDPPAVITAGQAIMAGLVDCLPAPDGGSGTGGGSLTGRLWGKLCPGPPDDGLKGALRAALVLLADHELAASTFAARVAASVRADPYAVVATGLGAAGGALHGGASLGVEAMLAAAAGPQDVTRVVGSLLRRGERIPGFGHFVYRAGDPRAAFLLGEIRARAPGSPRLAVADALVGEVVGRGLPTPNIDFALAVLASVAGMVPGAAEAVFAVARTAGWIGAVLTTPSSTSTISPAPSISTPRRSASRSGPRWLAVPPSCAPLAPRTTTTSACSRSTGPARSQGTPPRGWACITWRGRSARWPNWTGCGPAWPSAAPWSAPVTTGFPSRCTPRTPAASSSR
jgi:citrate synthase